MLSCIRLSILLATAIAALPALAQTPATINVDAINEASSTRINGDHQAKIERRRKKRQQRSREFLESMKGFASHFRLPGVDATTLPPRRELEGLDLAKKDLLDCVSDIIDRHSGGYEGPAAAQALLLKAMDNNSWLRDEATIRAATAECEQAYARLYQYRDSAIRSNQYFAAIEALPVNNAAQNKTVQLIKNLYGAYPLACNLGRTNLEGGAFAVFSVGLARLQCLLSDGVVRNYVGINASVILGFGGGINIQSRPVQPRGGNAWNQHSQVKAGSAGMGIAVGATNSNLIDIGSGIYAGPVQYTSKGARKQIHLGLKAEAEEELFELATGVRFVDGKRHWGLLIDVLN